MPRIHNSNNQSHPSPHNRSFISLLRGNHRYILMADMVVQTIISGNSHCFFASILSCLQPAKAMRNIFTFEGKTLAQDYNQKKLILFLCRNVGALLYSNMVRKIVFKHWLSAYGILKQRSLFQMYNQSTGMQAQGLYLHYH